MKRHHLARLLLFISLCCLLATPLRAADNSADEIDKARLFRLMTEPEKSDEYAAFIADLILHGLLEERHKHLLFVPPEIYATNNWPQSSFGRLLVADYRHNWNDAMNDLVGMLTRRGWLADALSPQGMRIPMSMEVDNKVMPLIGYIWPLLNQRDASYCNVERNQAARCYATISLQRNRQGDYTVRHIKIADAQGQNIRLPYVSPSAQETGEGAAVESVP